MFGDMWAETYGAYRDYHVDPEDLIQNYECSRCGLKGKSTDEDIHSWLNVNICEVDNNIWAEANDNILCPSCANKFSDIWFNFNKQSNCNKMPLPEPYREEAQP